MKIVIAPDSFKGSLSAAEICECLIEFIHLAYPAVTVRAHPLADGGEGTAAALVASMDGQWRREQVMGPLPELQVQAAYGWLEKKKTAVVEMAKASGLTLLDPEQRDPLKTGTYGTGQLIKRAALNEPEHLLLAVGGSATVDGGMGAAQALGWRFQDKHGKALHGCGGTLLHIHEIIAPASLKLPAMEVLSDVANPLLGPTGAARIFGPQKGATPDDVVTLEEGLAHLAALVRRDLGTDINVRGSGAAGGLAAGAVAFMNARIVSGIDRVMDVTGFDDAVRSADWIVTGEGSLDQQSLHGKVISGVLRRKPAQTRVLVLAGRVKLSPAEVQAAGIDQAVAVTPDEMSFADAVTFAPELLRKACQIWLDALA